MTLEEALVEVYEATDEQSDLEIRSGGVVSLATTGSLRLQGLLKRAQNAIALWKFPGGRRLRFRFMHDSALVAPQVLAATFDSGGSFPGNVAGLIAPVVTTNQLSGATLFVDDLPFPVVSNTSSSVTVAKTFADDPIDSDASFTWQKLTVAVAGKDIIQVTGIYDIENEVQLERAGDKERFASGMLEKGLPASYLPVVGGLLFDVCPEESTYFKVYFQRYPIMPAALASSFELPEAFHDAVCEYAKYTANMRIGKSESAQMAWGRLQSLMASLRQEADLEEDSIDKGVEVTAWL